MESMRLIQDFDSLSRKQQRENMNRVRDLIEFNSIDRQEVQPLSARLLSVIGTESKPEYRTDALDALYNLTSKFLGTTGEWPKLVALLPAMSDEELEFSLGVLGNTLEQEFLADIRAFLGHNAERVCIAAKDAERTMLEGRRNT